MNAESAHIRVFQLERAVAQGLAQEYHHYTRWCKRRRTSYVCPLEHFFHDAFATLGVTPAVVRALLAELMAR